MFFWSGRVINKPIGILLFISGAFMFAFAMFSPLYAIFVQKVGGGVTDAANAWSVFLLTAGVFTLITGKIENKMKEKELAIAWSQFIICLAYCLFYFTNSLLMLYLSMFVIGLANAFFWPAFHSIFDQHAEGVHVTVRWSLYDSLAYLVPAIGTFLGGMVVKFYGFGLLFLIMAGVSFLCGLLIVLLPRKVL